MANWWEEIEGVVDTTQDVVETVQEEAPQIAASAQDNASSWWDQIEGVTKKILPQKKTITYPDMEMEQPGFAESTLIGAGRTGDKMISGVQDLWYKATGNDEAQRALQQREADNDRIYGKLQEDQPAATMIGEILPYMALPGGAAAAPGRMLSKAALKEVGKQTAVGGALGGTHYNESVLGGAAGGAAGGAIGKSVGDLWRYWRGVGAGGPGQHAEKFYGLGEDFRLTPGERTGWDWLQRAEQAKMTHPISGAPTKAIVNARQEAINRKVAEQIGIPNANKLTDDVIDVAATNIKEDFGKLTGLPQEVDLHGDFLSRLVATEDAMSATIQTGGEPAKEVISKLLGVMKNQNGKITMDQYQQFSSDLITESRKAFRGTDKDYITGSTMSQVKNALDDAMEDQLGASGPEVLAQFKNVRERWKNLNMVQESRIVQGDISPASMFKALEKGSGIKRTLKGEFDDPSHIIGRYGRDYPNATGQMIFGGTIKPAAMLKDYAVSQAQAGLLGGRSPNSAALGGRFGAPLGIAAGSERGPVQPPATLAEAAGEEGPGIMDQFMNAVESGRQKGLARKAETEAAQGPGVWDQFWEAVERGKQQGLSERDAVQAAKAEEPELWDQFWGSVEKGKQRGLQERKGL